MNGAIVGVEEIEQSGHPRPQIHRIEIHRIEIHQIEINQREIHQIKIHRIEIHWIEIHQIEILKEIEESGHPRPQIHWIQE